MWSQIDLSTLDVVFISYDEPDADSNFAVLQQIRPDAKRIQGVKGFDAAHRAAGEIAGSQHVITIDGDNIVTDKDVLTSKRSFTPFQLTCMISFSAKVAHNGLRYGNGGMKIWPRILLQTLRTHEFDRRPTPGNDFAWNVPYVMVHDCPTETHVLGSPFGAFRAGYREGVRLVGPQTKSAHSTRLPDGEDLNSPTIMSRYGLPRLRAWCHVAPDTLTGKCAILGARLGCIAAVNSDFDGTTVSNFDQLALKWQSIVERNTDLCNLVDTLLQETSAPIASLGVTPPTGDMPSATRIGYLEPR